ncbi:MAG: MBL fold metallo-hydrolase [Ruminococcaceae bacterium]|nr:MBL fold metallo-hydrolase [Oscillospiraceae bacterium]
MKVITIPLPPIMTNCYISYEREGGKCFIIDPASSEDRIKTLIDAHSLKPKAILLTHGHFDHIAASDRLREMYSIPLYIHEADSEMIKNARLNCSSTMMGEEIILKDADKLLKDGDKLKLENESLAVMHTPGHSPGSCVFIASDCVFSGDTVFRGTYGRYDLTGGDFNLLMASIKRVMALPPILKVYPGHNEATTIFDESMYY